MDCGYRIIADIGFQKDATSRLLSGDILIVPRARLLVGLSMASSLK